MSQIPAYVIVEEFFTGEKEIIDICFFEGDAIKEISKNKASRLSSTFEVVPVYVVEREE